MIYGASQQVAKRYSMLAKSGLKWVFVMGSALLLGCVAVIPQELALKVDKSISFQELNKSPTDYQGKLVVLGGTILEAKNTKAGTELEILQKPLSYYDRPQDIDKSSGRFLALYKGYLDVAIYQSGREITMVGEVLGAETRPLGEIEYTYPSLEVRHIYLWEDISYSDRPTIIYHGISPYWGYYPYPHIHKDDH